MTVSFSIDLILNQLDMSEEIVESTQAERLNYVKLARETALVTDRLCANILAFAQKLEENHILDPERPSKIKRDKAIKAQLRELEAKDEDILALSNQINNISDPETIIASLYRDLPVQRVSKTLNKSKNENKKADKAGNSENAEDSKEDQKKKEKSKKEKDQSDKSGKDKKDKKKKEKDSNKSEETKNE